MQKFVELPVAATGSVGAWQFRRVHLRLQADRLPHSSSAATCPETNFMSDPASPSAEDARRDRARPRFRACSSSSASEACRPIRPTSRSASGAADWCAEAARDIGFEPAWCRPPATPWWSPTTAAERCRWHSARALLRSLRCAAARPARAVEDAAVRAAHRHRRRQRQGDRGARRGGQQGPAHDLPRGGAGLEDGRRRAAARGSAC